MLKSDAFRPLFCLVLECLGVTLLQYYAHSLGDEISWTSTAALCANDPLTTLAWGVWQQNDVAQLVLILKLWGFHLKVRRHCQLLSCAVALYLCPDSVFIKVLCALRALFSPTFPPKVTGAADCAIEEHELSESDQSDSPSSVCSTAGVGEVPVQSAFQFTGAAVDIQMLPALATQFSSIQALIAGEMHTAALTCGDGACALHAVWGIPRRRRGSLYCANAGVLVSR